jgi:hypothetical protein
MSARSRGRLAVAALVLPTLFGVAACDDEEAKAKEAATAACPASIDQTASTQVPADVPTPNGAKTYNYSSQGKTQVWFLALDGSSDQLASLRDAFNDQLKGKGYQIEGTDQEDGAEAEAEFKGPHEGTTNFRPLCSGKVVLRIKLTS